jgi:hypothetical protein
MKNSFDYKKAKRDAERMLEVIERDPQALYKTANWHTLQGLTSAIITLSVGMVCLEMVAKQIKDK